MWCDVIWCGFVVWCVHNRTVTYLLHFSAVPLPSPLYTHPFLTSPTNFPDVIEAPSITEGFEKHGKHGRAFVVRGTSDLSFDALEFAQAAREQDTHGEACTVRFERVFDVRLAR